MSGKDCEAVSEPGSRTPCVTILSQQILIAQYNRLVFLAVEVIALFRPQCNILEKVAPGSYRAIRKYVIEWILATDMKTHFDHISSFRTRRMNAEFNLANNEEDRS